MSILLGMVVKFEAPLATQLSCLQTVGILLELHGGPRVLFCECGEVKAIITNLSLKLATNTILMLRLDKQMEVIQIVDDKPWCLLLVHAD
jgi:hypothetical protein